MPDQAAAPASVTKRYAGSLAGHAQGRQPNTFSGSVAPNGARPDVAAGPAPLAEADRLPPRIYGIMAAVTFATWGTLAGSYEIFF